jgi:hypothetical protein
MADFVRAAFQELTEVTLVRPIAVHGVAMPAGTRGVVMAAYADGLAYEIEFSEPHVVLTIDGTDLRA